MVGAVEAAGFLLGHEALGYLLRHEPNRVIPAYGHLQGGLRHRHRLPRPPPRPLRARRTPRPRGRRARRPPPALLRRRPEPGGRPHRSRRACAASCARSSPLRSPTRSPDHGQASATNQDLIGRDDVNDLEAILGITNTDVDEAVHAVKDNAEAIFTWDYEKGQRPALNRLYEKAKTSMWNGETDLPWDTEVDQEQVVANNAMASGGFDADIDVSGTAARALGRAEVARVRRREPELDAQPVHARRAGRAGVHGQDRRDGAVDRRQVLRVHPGDGRGPPRRGVRQVPRHEAVGPLPDQRPPADAARRHRRGLPLGHDLPRHADHGGGPGAGRLRLHAPDDHRAAAQAAAALRDERRGPPRGLRRAVAEGVLRRAQRRRDARAPGVRVRGGRAHARPVPPAGGVGPHGHRSEGGGRPRAPGAAAAALPEHALQQDRAELQEARPARPQRPLAARASSPSSA